LRRNDLCFVRSPRLLQAMSDYRTLKVWRKSHALVLNIQKVASTIRGSQYGPLGNQMLRAAMSIPANVVEGTGKQTRKEFIRFLRIALNSSSELQYHLMLARDFKCIGGERFAFLNSQVVEIRKMLHGLISAVIVAPPKPPQTTPPRQHVSELTN
jgi:four helix bundle protein